MAHILFIEEATDLHSVVTESLYPEHQVTCVKTVSQARASLNEQDWDLLVLDIGFIDGDGFEFADEFRKIKKTPFIFLTGRSDIADKLKGFAVGAQDYVTKPFDSRELKARVNAHLSSNSRSGSEEFKNKTFKIHVPLQRAYAIGEHGDTLLNLTPIEFKLLYFFCTNENRVINRNELLAIVWGKGVNVLQRTIDKHISSLRQKLGPLARQLETIPQVGYRYST